MEKKNYNIEIFFESQKKSFVILSKNKITLDEVKARTIKEFNIPEEFEKDMRFSITIKNRLTTISNDFQIMKNFEEISKNNFYLKIVFAINNNNYIYQPLNNKLNNKNRNKNQKIEKNEEFTIIAKTSNKKGDSKYIEDIKKLKEEIEKLKNEKNKKPDFDIRKFDEKFRDLNNKNNDLEQKIFELENENKSLKLNQSKNNVEIIDNFENKTNNDILIKRIQKVFSKLITEHDKKIIKEINEMKIKLDSISKGQNIFEEKRQLNKNETDNNFELLNVDGETEKSLFFEKEENNNEKINKINDTIDGENEKKDNKSINIYNNVDEKNNGYINLNNADINSDYLQNTGNIINDNKNEKDNEINKINDLDKDNKDEKNTYLESIIKRNINFYEEDENEKNSKSFDNSINNMNIKLKSKDKSSIKNIKENFFENNKNKIPNCIFKKTKTSNNEAYSQFIIPNRIIEQEKIKAKNKKQIIKLNNINNIKSNNHLTKRSNLSEEDLINYESNSEINSYNKNLKEKVNISKYKNTKIKKEKNRNINQINNYALNEETPTPFSDVYTSDRKKHSFTNTNKNEKYQSYTTPNIKDSSIREDIDNYFINVFQNIFFYGNNEYVNMLNISDKLTKKLKDGLITYRKNMKDIKDCAIKYISYSIIPIINDINTKEYQRKILKDKIKTILEYLKADINYFEKEYKNNNDSKSDNKSEERNINGINITHSKINEFRKLYDLKEKDYPDEMLIKALIRYRGNKEMAFQYLFY